ncbi:MAG: ABC transporter permease [Elusimicrobiota bacterium]
MKSRGLAVYAAFFYALLYLPLSVMFVFSFNDARRNVIWHGFTFKWYITLLHDAGLLEALLTSLKIGLLSSAIASFLGLFASYALVCRPPRHGKAFYSSWLNAPLLVPEIVMGVGLLSFFVRIGLDLNFWTLAFAHAMIALPYTLGSIRARFLSLKSSQLEEAAMDLGADEWQAFYHVSLPLAKPAIISGALLAFTISFEDFVTSFFIAGIGVVTMPIKIYSMMKFGVTPEINALSCCLLALTLGILLSSQFFRRTAKA